MNKKTAVTAGLALLLALLIPADMFFNRMVNIFTSYGYITGGHIMTEEEMAAYKAEEVDDTLVDSTEEEISDSDAQLRAYLEENSELLQCDEYGITNILLIGCDAYGYDKPVRSDSMILLSLSKERNTIKMVSFMRDMRVYIPGKYRYNDKINAAMAFDSSCQLLLDTIEYNFKIPIDKFVLINWTAFADVVDRLGGISVSVDPSLIDYFNLSIADPAEHLTHGGVQTLNGNQALAYCRMRKADSDFMRTQRQRQFLTAMIRKLMRSSVPELIDAIEVTMPSVKTNMTFGELVTLAGKAAGAMNSEFAQLRIPADGTCWDITENQIMYLGFNAKKNINLLHEFIYADAEQAAELAAQAAASASDVSSADAAPASDVFSPDISSQNAFTEAA